MKLLKDNNIGTLFYEKIGKYPIEVLFYLNFL